VVDETAAMNLVKCEVGEQTYLPMDADSDSQKSFEELVRIDQIARGSKQNKNAQIRDEKLRGDDQVGRKRKKIVNDVESALIHACSNGQIAPGDADRVLDMIKDPRVNRKYKEIEALLEECRKTQNVSVFVDGVTGMANLLFLADRKVSTDADEQAYANPELVLVGAMFVSAEKYKGVPDMKKLKTRM